MWGGITIAENAVIGACALVNKNIPKSATAVGIPCKVIKETISEMRCQQYDDMERLQSCNNDTDSSSL